MFVLDVIWFGIVLNILDVLKVLIGWVNKYDSKDVVFFIGCILLYVLVFILRFSEKFFFYGGDNFFCVICE